MRIPTGRKLYPEFWALSVVVEVFHEVAKTDGTVMVVVVAMVPRFFLQKLPRAVIAHNRW